MPVVAMQRLDLFRASPYALRGMLDARPLTPFVAFPASSMREPVNFSPT